MRKFKKKLSRNEMRTISGAFNSESGINGNDGFCGGYCSYQGISCKTYSSNCYCSAAPLPFMSGYCTTYDYGWGY